MTSRGQCPRGVLVNVLKAEGDDVTRAMSKGGGACKCLHPPPLSGNPVSVPDSLCSFVRSRSVHVLIKTCP